MAIVQTINVYQFRDAFRDMQRHGNFSYEGMEILFNYLEEYSDSTGEPIELDVIALCCEYNESTVDEIIKDYQIDIDLSDIDQEDIESAKREAVEEYLQENTSVCGETADGFVYACF